MLNAHKHYPPFSCLAFVITKKTLFPAAPLFSIAGYPISNDYSGRQWDQSKTSNDGVGYSLTLLHALASLLFFVVTMVIVTS